MTQTLSSAPQDGDRVHQLLSAYDFVLCSEEQQFKEAHQLRIQVFHVEQGFPADTEIDEYDPISAHFILFRREDAVAVATIRLTPYPRKPWLKHAPEPSNAALPSPGLTQDQTSIVTSGGGPQGTSGALPINSSSGNGDEDHLPGTKSQGAPPEAAGDEAARKQFPLGPGLPQSELARRFLKSIQDDGTPIDEEEGAPKLRGAKVSRLAVSKSARGLGLGALCMQQAEGWLVGLLNRTSSRADTDAASHPSTPSAFNVVISSQMHAKPFYEKLGYSVFGEPYDEEGAPHCWCVKQLSNPFTS